MRKTVSSNVTNSCFNRCNWCFEVLNVEFITRNYLCLANYSIFWKLMCLLSVLGKTDEKRRQNKVVGAKGQQRDLRKLHPTGWIFTL